MENRSTRSKEKSDLPGVLRKSWYQLGCQCATRLAFRRGTPSSSRRPAPSKPSSTTGSSAGPRAWPDRRLYHALARHYWDLGLDLSPQVANENDNEFGSSVPHDRSNNEFPLLPMVSFIAKRHILLLHAGGDSKRVPWANPVGKVFLPLPYLASDDPDGPVPLLSIIYLQFLLALDKLLKMKMELFGQFSFGSSSET